MRARFGPFTLDLETRRLYRDADPLHLTPKAWQLLVELVNAAPRAMSKADLFTALWGDTFVEEANLTVLVAEIRAALEDPARSPRFIRTVHGFGYAFDAQIEREPAGGDAGPTWWLVTDYGRHFLTAGDHVVGREPSADVWIDSSAVSRRHARLRPDGNRVVIEDLGSKNGTWVNGAPVTGIFDVRDGDEIRFGTVTARLRAFRDTQSTQTAGPR